MGSACSSKANEERRSLHDASKAPEPLPFGHSKAAGAGPAETTKAEGHTKTPSAATKTVEKSSVALPKLNGAPKAHGMNGAPKKDEIREEDNKQAAPPQQVQEEEEAPVKEEPVSKDIKSSPVVPVLKSCPYDYASAADLLKAQTPKSPSPPKKESPSPPKKEKEVRGLDEGEIGEAEEVVLPSLAAVNKINELANQLKASENLPTTPDRKPSQQTQAATSAQQQKTPKVVSAPPPQLRVAPPQETPPKQPAMTRGGEADDDDVKPSIMKLAAALSLFTLACNNDTRDLLIASGIVAAAIVAYFWVGELIKFSRENPKTLGEKTPGRGVSA